MFQGFVERGFSHTESQTARFAALLGREPGKYSSYAEELTKQWTSQPKLLDARNIPPGLL
jgi:hypothetical protein